MRAGKKILLVGTDEIRLSIMRYMLRMNCHTPNASNYAVTTARTVQAALQLLRTNTYDLLLVQHPIESLKVLTRGAKKDHAYLPIFILTDVMPSDGRGYPDGVLYKVSNMYLLECIKSVITRKGPRIGSIEAARCGFNKKHKPVASQGVAMDYVEAVA